MEQRQEVESLQDSNLQTEVWKLSPFLGVGRVRRRHSLQNLRTLREAQQQQAPRLHASPETTRLLRGPVWEEPTEALGGGGAPARLTLFLLCQY